MPAAGGGGDRPIGKVDVHTHILPPEWPAMAERAGYGGWPRLERCDACSAKIFIDDRFFRAIESNCYRPEPRLEECDAHGVGVQVLSTVPVLFSYWAEAGHAHDLIRYLNDHLAETARTYPRRFVALGTLPMQDPGLACRELERCITDLGMAGVEIGTHVNDWNLDEPALFPVFERARDLGAAVFVHPWDMAGKERMPRYFLPWLVGMPAETSLAICSLIFGGVLDRLPGLRLLFAHGGGSFPGTIGRIERGFACRPDLCQVHTKRSPRSYLGELWVDSLVHDPVQLQAIVGLFGEDRVALGTDYPFPLGEPEPGATIAAADLPDEVREKLLWRNALGWLGVDERLRRTAGAEAR